jgi:3-deoxy-manno-octulosonate cytidylyltransferase (CMP-KDO synthetase)
MHSDVVIIIPSRIGSTRLKDKPLQMIGDLTMIEHVVSGVSSTNIAGIFVATDSDQIYSLLTAKGHKVLMTNPDCPRGSDRVYEAFKTIPNHDKIKYIINVQGDMPFIKGSVILDIIQGLKNTDIDIMTSGVKVGMDVAASDSNVKIVTDNNNRALYFSRSLIPYGSKEFLYHVGIYGFKAAALERFVFLEQSENEKLESLEQLRALDNGMSIGVCYSNEVPISVDTAEDLAKAREYWAGSRG